MTDKIGGINTNNNLAIRKKKEPSGKAPVVDHVPADSVEIGEDSGFIAKSRKGWDLLGDRLYESKIVQGHHRIKTKIKDTLKWPFKGIMKKINEMADDDDAELEIIKKKSAKNLQRFAGKTKNFPSSRTAIKYGPNGDIEYSDDSFWERHPIMRSFYLGFKALKKMPMLLLKIPRMLFRILIPAAYGESGKGKMVGSEFVGKIFGGLKDNSWARKAYSNFSKLMNVPGVALAMSIVGPVFGLSRMGDGLIEFKEGVKNNNPYQMLDGKVDMMTGALAAIKPLALLAIVTEGVHIYLNYRVKKKGMDPERANNIMSNIFAAVTAPIGLAAYALLAPPKKRQAAVRPDKIC